MCAYVSAGCLEAALGAGASNGTLPTCVMVTSDMIPGQEIGPLTAPNPSADRSTDSEPGYDVNRLC